LNIRESLLGYINLGNRGGLRGLGADSVVYGGGRALQAIFGLFTLPLVARILTPEELGQAAIILIFPSLLAPLAVVGQDLAVLKFLSEEREDFDEADVNATALAIQALGILVSVLVTCAVGIAFSTRVEEILGWGLFGVALVSVLAGVLFAITLVLSKSWFLRGVFLGTSLLQVILYTIFLVASVVILRYGVYGYTLSGAAALLVASVVGLYLMRERFLGGRISWKLAGSMFRYGAPYVAAGLLVTFVIYMDRLVLSWRASIADIGVYWVAVRYAAILQMALEGFRIAWWPFAFSSYSASGDSGLFGRTLSAYAVAAGCLVVGLYSLSGIGIDILAGETYTEALIYVLPLLLAEFLRGFQLSIGVGIAISGRSFWAPLGTLAGAVVGIGVILALWPALGVVSAAWGVVGGELTAFVVTAIISQRFLPLRWQFKRALTLIGILLLYLVSLETGLTTAGPIQTFAFLLIYCTIGWYALKGLPWPSRSQG
jgi:O-antigen/teichoic acid export membrane protein